MRVSVAICSAALALLATTASANASARHTLTGRLTGTTKIDAGCPAVTPGGNCNPWQLFPHAQFTVTRLTAGGATLAGTTRTVKSDAGARFRVVLRPGSYLVKPSPGTRTKGGSPLAVHVTTRAATKLTVRFTAKFKRV